MARVMELGQPLSGCEPTQQLVLTSTPSFICLPVGR